MRRFLIGLLFIAQAAQIQGASYYVKPTGGTGAGTSDATALNYDTFKSRTFQPGDSVFFWKGSAFGSGFQPQSGAVGNRIYYGSYGAGSAPTFSGLTPVTSWSLVAGHIYAATVDVPFLSVVTINDQVRAMGRYPKTGYLTYTGHSGKTTITGPDVASLPFNPVGSEVVVRKIRQVTDRNVVTFWTGSALGFSNFGAIQTPFFNSDSWEPSNEFGFFIQNSQATLTLDGEWAYDAANKKLLVYFQNAPASYNVRVATQAKLIDVLNLHDVTLQGLNFEGASYSGFYSNGLTNATIDNCSFRLSFNALTWEGNSTNVTVQNCTLSNLTNDGLLGANGCNGIIVKNCALSDIGTLAGMGGCSDAQQLGIWLAGINLTVQDNTIQRVGYHGIVAHGDNTLVQRNTINTFGLSKDDCAGVYDYQFAGITSTNKIIQDNTILNGFGPVGGVPFYALRAELSGVYLDANCNHIVVRRNKIYRGAFSGLLNVDVGPYNEWYDNDIQEYLYHTQFLIYTVPLRNVSYYRNKNVGKTQGQVGLFFHQTIADNPQLFGSFHDNIYNVPGANAVAVHQEYTGGQGYLAMPFTAWKQLSGQEVGSSSNAKLTRRGSRPFKVGNRFLLIPQ